jgi:type IV pilus assembly protein PilQ
MNIRVLFSGRALLLLLFSSMLAFAGCSTQKSAVKAFTPNEKVQQEAEQKGAFLKLISVVGIGDAVIIEANVPVKYTAFRLSDPPRLIVDFPGVDIRKIKNPMEINNNYLTVITTSSYGESDEQIGRVEMGLMQGINHELKSGENSVLVKLERDIYIPGASAFEEEMVEEREMVEEEVELEEVLTVGEEGAMEEEAQEEEALVEEVLEVGEERAEEEVISEEKVFEEMVEPEEEEVFIEVVEEVEEALKDATMLLTVDSSIEQDTTLIKIVADGAMGNYNSFGLDDPTRFVIDIWGVGSAIEQNSMSIGGPHIEKVRIGKHPDKVRMVFDSTTAELPNHIIGKEGDAMLVAFGVAPVIPVPEEPEVLEEPVEALGVEETVEVKKVDFRKFEDVARLTVVTSGEPSYEVRESLDGKTITLDLKDAFIPEELKATLDATELRTPVATISSFQASLDPEMDVRILVRLRDKAIYNVRDEENTINVDFLLKVAVAENTTPMAPPEPAPAVEKVVEEAEELFAPKKYTGRRIDLDMVDVEIRDILKLLAEVSELNIVATDEVKGKMTLRLKNVPWDQAFDLILKSKGLDKVQEGNIVRVAPTVKLARERQELLAAKKAEEKLEDLETEYVRISYDEAVNLEAQVIKLLSDRGEVTSHEPTNTLIIKDIRSGIDEALEYLKRVDIPTPQVLIEARIIEAENSFARDLGIQWGVDYRVTGSNVNSNIFGSSSQLGSAAPDPNQQLATFTGGGVTNQDKSGGFLADVGVTNYAVNLPATGIAGPLGGLGFILGKTGANPVILDLRITAGEQEGIVKTISRPRIITLDNKEAKIEQGESVPFETTSAAGTATTFIDANLSLTVTPQITPDGSVLMEIKASSNSIGSFRTSAGEPSINKREASTEVLVRDGETTVIGGIVVSDTSTSDRGIPFFKDIPVLGWLFKSKSVSDIQRELLIFITPSIVEDRYSS